MKFDSKLSFLLYATSLALAAPAPAPLAKRAGTSYSGGITADDIADGICAPVTFIFARGSTEIGNMGSTVGPALAKALIALLGNDGVAIQGVDYTASIESNILLGSEGGKVMAALAQKALSACPDTKIALSGYSQGAMVCHYAVASAGLSADDVAAVVLYGDPEDGTAVGDLPDSKLEEFCASGDGVCELHTFAITAAHLSYTTGSDISEGASFIQSAVGSSNSSSGASTSLPGSSTTSGTTAAASSSSILSGLGDLFGRGS